MNEILQRLQNLPEDRRAKIVELFNRYDPTTPGVIEYVSGRDIHDRASSANPSPVRVVRATKYEAAMQRIAALEDELNRVKTMLAAAPEAKQVDELRAKIEAMERQVPHSYIYRYWNPLDGSPVWRHEPGNWNGQQPGACAPLYALPGAKENDDEPA